MATHVAQLNKEQGFFEVWLETKDSIRPVFERDLHGIAVTPAMLDRLLEANGFARSGDWRESKIAGNHWLEAPADLA